MAMALILVPSISKTILAIDFADSAFVIILPAVFGAILGSLFGPECAPNVNQKWDQKWDPFLNEIGC